MAVPAFTNWQRKPASELARFNRSSPALEQLAEHLTAVHGGANLGIFQVRPVRGGRSLSSHSFGAALDWSYRGLGRPVGGAVCDWLVANAAALGVSAVHDYIGARIWHADRQAWKTQRKDATGMGQPWADWLHVEVAEGSWGDARSVAEKLGTSRPTLRVGSVGPAVKALQEILTIRAGQDVGRPDGRFGNRTLTAWRNVAAFCQLPPDDQVGGADWDTLAVLDRGWDRLNAAGVR